MKKISKVLMGGAFLLGFGVSSILNPKQVLATTAIKNPDIIPPKGTISIEGATLKDGVFYTDSLNVTLNIEALDETTSTENIKMIVSDGPIAGEIATYSGNWEPYSPTKEDWPIKAGEENLIYLYLKDEAGNISPNIVADATSNYTITYAGEGENMPAPKSAQYGMLFNVSIQEPTLEGKYFVGWSETEGGSVQWLSDSVIEPKYIKGNKTLYAIYADEAPQLADMVEIGDYVDYPVPYENVFTASNNYKSPYTGWRVLDISGDEVTIVSAGTPLTYHHGNNTTQSVKNLTTNFLSGDEYSNGEFTFENSGFRSSKLTTVFGNEFTKKVEAINKDDIDKIVGEVTTAQYDIRRYGSLLDNGTHYWLASAYSSTGLWYVNGGNGDLSSANNTSCGVRPKVTLVSDIRTTGRNISGVWKLEMP